MKVYSVSVRGGFYLMADDDADARMRAEGLCKDLEADIPGHERLSVDVYEVRRQDDYMRSRCINADYAGSAGERP